MHGFFVGFIKKIMPAWVKGKIIEYCSNVNSQSRVAFIFPETYDATTILSDDFNKRLKILAPDYSKALRSIIYELSLMERGLKKHSKINEISVAIKQRISSVMGGGKGSKGYLLRICWGSLMFLFLKIPCL